MTVPSLENCIKIDKAGEYSMIPLSLTLYSDNITPIVLLHRLNTMSYHSFLLESVEGGEQWGRYSFLGFDPVKSIECKNSVVLENGKNVGTDPMDYIRRDLSAYKTPKFEYLPPFTGGYVGFFSYDAVNYFEPAVNIDAADPLGLPDLKLMLFDKIICFDHYTQKLTIIINIRTDDLQTNYKIAKNEFQKLMQLIKAGEQLNTENPIAGRFSSNMTKDEFIEKVKKI
ncbi:MAG: anthranilate synthase component I, partial [Clostridiales bacterium]|nr:anthranilate synthase component I [Clostridiales bacterium]